MRPSRALAVCAAVLSVLASCGSPGSGSDDAATSNRSSTAVDTLLTFCPPGPDALTNRSSISVSSSAIASLIRIIDLSA